MGQRRQAKLAFAIDPSRTQFFSLRQFCYDAAAQDISDWASAAAAEGRKLSVLDVGCGWGVLLLHPRFKPHFECLTISATELREGKIYVREPYREIFYGDLLDGYPQIPSQAYDVVVCDKCSNTVPKSISGSRRSNVC